MTRQELYVKALLSLRDNTLIAERERMQVDQMDNDDDLIREAVENKQLIERIDRELCEINSSANLIPYSYVDDNNNRFAQYNRYFDLQGIQKRNINAG